MAAPALKTLTDDQYFDLERSSPTKHQLWSGELFAMAGASAVHNVVCANVIRALGNAVLGSRCRVLTSDQRIAIRQRPRTYLYADAVVACGPLSIGKHDTLDNPTVLVEVLSDSTEAFDRGDKFDAYTTVPSVQHVVFVSTKRKHVEVFTREPDGDFRRTATSEAGRVSLRALDVGFTLAEVYEQTDELLAAKAE